MSANRAFSVTVRQPDGQPIVGAAVCVNDRCGRTAANGRARVEGISQHWHQVQLAVEADGFTIYSESVNLDPGDPPFGDVDWPDLTLESSVPAGLRVEGDHFMRGSTRWAWKGSTDFRLIECVLRGIAIGPILADRKDAGANLVRLLSMKADNTGWRLDPRASGHRGALRKTFDALGDAQLSGELCIFADTKSLMVSPREQQDYYHDLCGVVQDYPHILLELLNEDKHATQAIDAQAFSKPPGILSCHGSGLSDVQPVKPLWDYATYHARRSGPIGKMLSNYSPYVFQDTFPTPVPYVPEESIKPQQYGYDTRVADCMGEHANCGAGGTFHHDAWNEPRLFNEGERACARAFYEALTP